MTKNDDRPAELAPVRDARAASGARGRAYLGLLLGAIASFYAPLLAGRVIYHRDVARWLYPARAFVRATLARGQSPWWHPDIGLGFPTLADPLYGLFYPPNLLHLLGPLPTMVMLVMLLHLVAGAFGVVCLVRRFGLGYAPAAIGGLAWALSSYLCSLWTTGVLLLAAAWLPWFGVTFVTLADRLVRGAPWRRATVAAALVVAASLLLGEVFVAIMGVGLGCSLAVVWAALEMRSVPGGTRGRGLLGARLVGLCGLALAIGAATSMVALWPAVRALPGTERAAPFPAEYAEAWSLHPLRLVELAAPVGFGRAWDLRPTAPWAQIVLEGRPFGMSVYLGASVLALGLIAFRSPRQAGAEELPASRRARLLPWLLAALTVLGLALALGRHTPAHGWLRVLVPPLARMRAPEKYLILVAPIWALLASLGAARLLGEPRMPWRRLAVLGTAFVALGVGVPRFVPPELAPFIGRGGWHAALAVAGVAVAGLTCRWRPRAAGVVLALVVGGDLALAAFPIVDFAPAAQLAEPPAAASAIAAAAGGDRQPHPRLFRFGAVQEAAAANGLAREQISRQTLRDNISVPFDVAILPGYEAALPPEVDEVLSSGRRSALALLGVEYALLTAQGRSARPADELEDLGDPTAGVRLYRIRTALPRVFVTARAEVLAAADIQARLLDADVAGGELVVIEPGEADMPPTGPRAPPTPCTLESFTTTRVVATCAAAAPGVAVFVEQYAPGWSARVDGLPAPLWRVDGFLRAVPLGAGPRRIELEYRPPGLTSGLALTLAGIALALLMLLWPTTRLLDHPSDATPDRVPDGGRR